MVQFLYKIFILIRFSIAATAAATGLSALGLGVSLIPFALVVLSIPAFAFFFFTRDIIYKDTVRRISNRGMSDIADVIYEGGRNLDRIDASRADLARLNLEGFSWRSADLEEAKLQGVRGKSIDFTLSDMEKAKLSRGNFRYGRFFKSKMKKAKLRYGNFKGANFSKADLRGSNLKGANFKGANFNGARLRGAVFSKKTTLPFDKSEAFDRGMVFV